MQILRDWRYIGPILGLVAITVIAAALARSSDDHASAVVAPTGTAGTRQPTASTTAAPPPTTPSIAATPNLEEVLQDSRRKLDLAALRDALEAYRTRVGGYPSTNSSFQTACSDPKDALCALNGVASNLTFSDGKRAYEYRSDGSSYTLYAEVQTEAAAGGCAGEVPPDLAGHQVFCLSSQRGGQ